MSAFGFPTSPTDGQVFSKWVYNATLGSWVLNEGATALGSTDDLPEGSSNLYYTSTRADSDIASELPNTDALTEGSSNLYYTSGRVDSLLFDTTDSGMGTLAMRDWRSVVGFIKGWLSGVGQCTPVRSW